MTEEKTSSKEKEYGWLEEVRNRYKDGTWSRKVSKEAFGTVSIYRIPKFLKHLDEKAYVPRVASLGLFHLKLEDQLPEMDRRKVDAVLRMRQRLPADKKNNLDEVLRDIVPDIRKCYEEEFEAEDETIAWACLLDGCFILEILDVLSRLDDDHYSLPSQTRLPNVEEEECDPIYNKNRLRSCQFDILGDFFLLENQIPIVVLVKLLELEKGPDAKKELYRKLRDITSIIHPFLPDGQPKEEGPLNWTEADGDLQKYKHMLGLFHSFVAGKDPPSKPNQATGTTAGKQDGSCTSIPIKQLLGRTPKEQQRHQEESPQNENDEYLNRFIKASASELFNAGVKFKPYYGLPSPKKLRFDNKQRALYLPAVFLTDTSDIIFRNLMALEVCRPAKDKRISYYVLLMNTLVEGESDVATLRRAGVIQSSMGTDDEVTDLLNELCKGLNLRDEKEDPFVEMKLRLNHWYNNRRMVQLNRFLQQHPRLLKYFSLFWAMVLVLAAALPSFLPIFKKLLDNGS